MTTPIERVRRALQQLLENPPPKALEAVDKRKVIRIAVRPVEQWIVVGEHADYIVIPRVYCSCPAFTINGVLKGVMNPCYHMVAVEIAKRLGRYIDVSAEVSSEKLLEIINEVFSVGRSATLRRILGW